MEVKGEPCLCSLWVDKWKFQYQYQEANRIVETPRESSRIPEKPWEAQRNLEKPWENPRSLKQPREASRRPEKTWESSTWGFYEFREGSLSALLFVCLPPAPQKIMVEMLRNHTEVKPGAFSTLLDFTLLLPQFSFKYLLLLSSIGYNIHLHYMILPYCLIFNNEKWLCRIALK